MDEQQIPYMGSQWLLVEGNIVTVGINEEGLQELEEIAAVDLPEENEEVTADEICGELDSRDGPLNIYSPVSGTVLELNHAVIDTPELAREDCFGEGWLMRIEAADEDEISRLQADHNIDDN